MPVNSFLKLESIILHIDFTTGIAIKLDIQTLYVSEHWHKMARYAVLLTVGNNSYMCKRSALPQNTKLNFLPLFWVKRCYFLALTLTVLSTWESLFPMIIRLALSLITYGIEALYGLLIVSLFFPQHLWLHCFNKEIIQINILKKWYNSKIITVRITKNK